MLHFWNNFASSIWRLTTILLGEKSGFPVGAGGWKARPLTSGICIPGGAGKILIGLSFPEESFVMIVIGILNGCEKGGIPRTLKFPERVIGGRTNLWSLIAGNGCLAKAAMEITRPSVVWIVIGLSWFKTKQYCSEINGQRIIKFDFLILQWY